MPRFDRSHTDDLAEYIRRSPTPYHACAVAGERLEAAGFRRLAETEEWPGEAGGYYVVRDGSIVAWRQNGPVEAFRIFGAHTDSPTLKVKPRPDTGSAGWKQVACEVYGGVPRDAWLDRDLGVAGRLVMRDGSHVLVHVDRPVLRVPRLAIHLDRKVNEEGQKLNPQTQLTPVWGLGEPREGEFLEFAAAEAGVEAKDVLGFDLFTAACDRPSYLGKDGELFAAWRLDNLLSTHAGLAGLIAAEDAVQTPVFVSFNYEEIGSMTYSAAQSPFLENVLRRVAGGGHERFARLMAASRMMSADTGHALHPNYAERHEPGHRPVPNGGPMLKVSANQRYATGAEEQAVFVTAAERAGVPWQYYVNRNDIPGGTTIGPLSGTQLGVVTVDVGAAVLSMHSSRELCGADDPAYLADLALGLYTCDLSPVRWSRRREAIREAVLSWRAELERAARALRDVAGFADRAERLLAEEESRLTVTDTTRRRRELSARLRRAAEDAAGGWLGEELHTVQSDTPVWTDEPVSGAVRLGTAELEGEPVFPALVELLGRGHLAVDADAADPRVAGLLQSLLVRLVAAYPGLELSLVDGVTLGQVFSPATPLIDAGLADHVATDHLALGRVLTDAEKRLQEVRDIAARGQSIANRPFHLVMVAGMPPQVGRSVRERLAALAHAGPAARTHLVLCGWRASLGGETLPALEHTAYLRCGDEIRLGELPLPVRLDQTPSPTLARAVFDARADQRREASTLTVADLVPERIWTESSRTGLSTVIGRDAGGDVTVSFDDATPHWLIGGRTGGGKTVFLLDALYGLAARYSPEELELYLLDFKEGVSFTEFTPSAIDESWIPHVRAVGVESDREYGVAVLGALRSELSRRAGLMKRAGATRLARLRELRPEARLPRIVAVVDEFHVLFSGNDRLAREAVAHLEELARKGRSYGVHLVLASQTISGVEALYAKKDSIFGQFPLRVALPGARHLLADDNHAAESISLGQAVVNDSGGVKGRDRTLAFPDASAAEDLLAALRHRLWERRESDVPPVVFRGFDEQHLTDDPSYAALRPTPTPRALLGRAVDVDVSTVGYHFDRSPGRHLAVLGTSPVAADVLAAAATSLGRQHEPGSVEFLVAATAAGTEDVAAGAVAALESGGHRCRSLAPGEILSGAEGPAYLVWFGADGADGSPLALRELMMHGPAAGLHLIGWWRGARRFLDDIGGASGREHCAGLVALNVAASDLGAVTGDPNIGWEPRANRCLVVDRHAGTERLAVPYVRPGRLDEYGTE